MARPRAAERLPNQAFVNCAAGARTRRRWFKTDRSNARLHAHWL
jgi:hypothetical protein